MRAFIAIELPKEIKDHLSRIQAQLRTAGADVRWVDPKNIHLTLKFLGEIDDKKKSDIIEIIEDTAKNNNQFLARICCAGAFPKISFPRVLWVGIQEGDKETKEIALALEEKIDKLGIPREDRPFSSHITIGRIKSTSNREKLVRELETIAANLNKESLIFSINKITFFKSTLTPHGPVYEILKEATLKAT